MTYQEVIKGFKDGKRLKILNTSSPLSKTRYIYSDPNTSRLFAIYEDGKSEMICLSSIDITQATFEDQL